MAFISPLQDFPVELLCEIFHYYSATECPYSSRDISDIDEIKVVASRAEYQRTPRWLAVLLVCRTWYSVAIRHQPLWTRLDFNSAQLTKFFLARAGSRPLDVAAFLPPNPNLDAIRLVLAEFQRIRTLLLFACDPDDLISILESYRFTSAPMLEMIMLNPDFSTSQEFDDDPTIDVDESPDDSHHVLLGPMPRLQSLYAGGLRLSHMISARPDAYPCLRHLRVDGNWNFFLDISLKWFPSELQKFTRLESLVLEIGLPEPFEEESDESEDEGGSEDQSHEDEELHVRLPEKAVKRTFKLPDTLTMLEIIDDVAQIDVFFQYIDILPSLMLRLKIWLNRGPLNVRATRLHRLCSRIPVDTEAPLAVLAVHGMWHYMGWEGYVRHSLYGNDLGRCRLNIKLEDSESSMYALFARALTHGLDLRSTMCLIFERLGPLDASEFFSIFQPAENVREIRIGPRTLRQVLTMVSAFPALWPALDAVTVRMSCQYPNRDWSLLTEALQSRKRQGMGIQSLQILLNAWPHPHEALYGELMLLRRFVPTVIILTKSPILQLGN
ncbi:hypothetical protein EWM64_g1668 [Hericium alpestre]|uniref:F-box domain-containing protein n=1 Tax=Hericium alpestre TaxID=135208 RepID=A0A4Z0A7U4_9AGAM|nr:hypothetical protein EWM64_g1668 [Hericium alpestre]